MITLNENMETEQNYVRWILIALLFILQQHFYEYISDDVERWFDTSNFYYNDKRTLLTGKNKKVMVCLKMN